MIILTECLRQKEDTVYQGILERARNVTLTQEDVDLLNSCTIACRKSKGHLLPDLSITTKNRLRHELNFLHVVDYAKSRQQKVYVFAARHKPIAFKTVSQTHGPNPPDISFITMLETQDSNELKGSGLMLYTKNMPVMCLSNVSTGSGVVNGMCGVATCIVPDPSGTISLFLLDFYDGK